MRKIVHQSDREAWLAARQSYITASDLVVALGESKYMTRDELVLSKLGLFERSQPDDESRELGLMLEDALQALVRRRWGWPVEAFGWLVEDELAPYMAATPDLIMQTPWGPAVVDMKVTSAQAQEDCKPDRYGNPSKAKYAHGCPLDYAMQLQCQMACLGKEYKWAAVLALHCVGGFKMRAYSVRRSEAVIANLRATATETMLEVQQRRSNGAT